jgi:ribosome biogenesis SPOUT family RNA methylase Rps3
MSFAYVIEHMEEDEETTKAIPPWVELEYAHMRTLAGPGAQVYFTNLSRTSSDSLAKIFNETPKNDALARTSCYKIGVLDLMKQSSVSLEEVCLLDPKAEEELSPKDGDGRFSWFLFGGILGDDPPRDRTSELRSLGFPTRNLGPVQMTTDTALGVTKKIVHDKIPLDKIPYVDYPTIRFNPKESVEMPFSWLMFDFPHG